MINMIILETLKRIYRTIRLIPQIYKYGGITNVNVAQIRYGGSLFSENCLVLITGGSDGIGLSMARRFVEEGATVVITGRNSLKLSHAKDIIQSDRLFTIVWDASDISVIPQKIEEIEKMTCKQVSVLINNAGTYSKTQFPHTTSDDWDFVYNTNLKSLYFISQYFINLWLNETNQGVRKIINISSQGGMVVANNAYRMTKWDIRGFTKYLGTFASKGIIANAIAPGIILTNMQPSFKKQGNNLFTKLNPVNRLGLPEEIAELAIFLSCNASNFIVGETICCDGGYNIK